MNQQKYNIADPYMWDDVVHDAVLFWFQEYDSIQAREALDLVKMELEAPYGIYLDNVGNHAFVDHMEYVTPFEHRIFFILLAYEAWNDAQGWAILR